MKGLIRDGLEESEIRNTESDCPTREQRKVAVKILDSVLVLCPFFVSFFSNVPSRLLCVVDAFSRNNLVKHPTTC